MARVELKLSTTPAPSGPTVQCSGGGLGRNGRQPDLIQLECGSPLMVRANLSPTFPPHVGISTLTPGVGVLTKMTVAKIKGSCCAQKLITRSTIKSMLPFLDEVRDVARSGYLAFCSR